MKLWQDTRVDNCRLTFQFSTGDGVHVEWNKLEKTVSIDGDWRDLKKSTELLQHLNGTHTERFHAVKNIVMPIYQVYRKLCATHPIFVISFPWTCKNEITKRLFNSDGSICLSSSSSLLSTLPIAGSSGAVRWTLHPSSGCIHVSFLKLPSKRCSFSFNRRRFFSSRFRWLNSYWKLYRKAQL